jgi:RNA-directed DNA polymerase
VERQEVKLKMENIKSWNDIVWSEIDKRIFRLQNRIYTASLNGEIKKVHKLQNLMLDSMASKLMAVRIVSQESTGKHIGGVDGVKNINLAHRLKMAQSMIFDGKSSRILRLHIPKLKGGTRLVSIPTMEDRAKQTLVTMALSPQWEAKFESSSYGFRPGGSVHNAMEAVFLSISREPQWVLHVDIEKSFDKINHKKLLDKCDTFPRIGRQIKSWLKAGILAYGPYTLPSEGPPQAASISSLLANIALHGLQSRLDEYVIKPLRHKTDKISSIAYVRYGDDFLVMHKDLEVLEGTKTIIMQFLQEMDLEMSETNTRVAHTYRKHQGYKLGFTFLGFDVIQRDKYFHMRRATGRKATEQGFITLITPSKEEIISHKLRLKEIIRKSRGLKQENIIYQLNPVIRGWALSKKAQMSSVVFTDLDRFIFTHLWKWACKRHPNMSRIKLKERYWHSVGKSNWVFCTIKEGKIENCLQKHSSIHIQRHVKIKENKSLFDHDNVLGY